MYLEKKQSNMYIVINSVFRVTKYELNTGSNKINNFPRLNRVNIDKVN